MTKLLTAKSSYLNKLGREMNLFSIVRSKSRYVVLALVTILLSALMAGVSFGSQRAQAAINQPMYDYSKDLIEDVSVHTDGSLTIYTRGRQLFNRRPQIVTVSPEGKLTNTVKYSDKEYAWNVGDIRHIAPPLGGGDGTVYVPQFTNENGGSYRLAAIRNNQLLWAYKLPCERWEEFGTPKWTSLGYDGNIYAVLNCYDDDHDKVVSISAKTGKARFAPVDLEARVFTQYQEPSHLGTFPGGFVVVGQPDKKYGIQVTYYTERGTVSRKVQTIIDSLGGGNTQYVFSPTGRVYITNLVSSRERSIHYIDPSGRQGKLTVALPSTAYEYSPLYLSAMPNNGLAVMVDGGLRRFSSNNKEIYRVDLKKLYGYGVDSSVVSTDSKGNNIIVNLVDRGQFNDYISAESIDVNGNRRHIWNSDQYFGETRGIALVPYKIIVEPGVISLALCWNGCFGYDNSNAGIFRIDAKGIGYDYSESARYKPNRTENDYVALGDSFSSGEGVPPFLEGTNTEANKCHRSTWAYAMQLDNDPSLGLSLGGSAIERFRACSGARSENLSKGSQGEKKRQLYYVNDKTKVITMTIGGNNVEFGTFVENCLVPKRTCQEGSDAYKLTKGNIDNLLHKQLTKLYKEIQEKLTPANKSAKVYVSGYPYVVKYRPQLCQAPLLTGAERKAIEKITLLLNQKIAGAIKQLGDARFKYIDPLQASSPFTDHDLCSKDSYFNGYNPTAPEAFTAHPNFNGQRAYARLFTAAMS